MELNGLWILSQNFLFTCLLNETLFIVVLDDDLH